MSCKDQFFTQRAQSRSNQFHDRDVEVSLVHISSASLLLAISRSLAAPTRSASSRDNARYNAGSAFAAAGNDE
jgi:hypothetical protein